MNIVFGITGGIACGKSTATKIFKSVGFPIVDADIIAREVVVPGSTGLRQVVSAFGEEYLNLDGTLNRIKLGNLVFSDKYQLSKLNEIMVPLIREESLFQVNKLSKTHPIVGYDAALIIEWGLHKTWVSPLIVVYCEPEIQLSRLMSRNSLTEEQAMARIKAQIPASEKRPHADFEINTSGPIEQSASKAREISLKLINLSHQLLNNKY